MIHFAYLWNFLATKPPKQYLSKICFSKVTPTSSTYKNAICMFLLRSVILKFKWFTWFCNKKGLNDDPLYLPCRLPYVKMLIIKQQPKKHQPACSNNNSNNETMTLSKQGFFTDFLADQLDMFQKISWRIPRKYRIKKVYQVLATQVSFNVKKVENHCSTLNEGKNITKVRIDLHSAQQT